MALKPRSTTVENRDLSKLASASKFILRNIGIYDASQGSKIDKGVILCLTKEETPESPYFWKINTAKTDVRFKGLFKALELEEGADLDTLIEALLERDSLLIHRINDPKKVQVLKASPYSDNPGVLYFEDYWDTKSFGWVKSITKLVRFERGSEEETEEESDYEIDELLRRIGETEVGATYEMDPNYEMDELLRQMEV